MIARRSSRPLGLAGILLFLAGLALWRAAPLDLAIHHAMRLYPGTVWVRCAVLLSLFGGLAVLGPVAIVAAGALWWWRGERGGALWLFVTIASGRLVVEGVKELVRRPRPPVADRLADVSSWSFPSSHSAGTMMTLLAFALVAGGRWPVVAAALAMAGAVGWSRVALGVHWPSDVLAGWGFGLLWVGAAWRYGGPMRSG